MGNRAVITTAGSLDVKASSRKGLYLHWNGGRDSVEAFLGYCRIREFKSPEVDNSGWENLRRIIENFFGSGTSVEVDECRRLDCDNWDNGVYIIKDWEIIDRVYFRGAEQNQYNFEEMLLAIDRSQPSDERIGEERIRAFVAKNI